LYHGLARWISVPRRGSPVHRFTDCIAVNLCKAQKVELGCKVLYLSILQCVVFLCLPSSLALIHCVYAPCVMAPYCSLIYTFCDWSVRVRVPKSGSACPTSWLGRAGATACTVSGRASLEFGVRVLFRVPVSLQARAGWGSVFGIGVRRFTQRRFVAVDGIFLKARFIQTLLLAVGINADGHNTIWLGQW
jgi:hypothetical protein